jgi:hypothetical protein
VINNAVLYPFEQDDIKTSSDFEKQMSQMINSLLEAKFIMIMHTYAQNAQQLYDASHAPLTEEQTAAIEAEIKGEE